MEDSATYNKICNLEQSDYFLNQYGNCLQNIDMFLQEFCMEQENWADYSDVENRIKSKLEEIYSNCNFDGENSNFKVAVNCTFFNRIHNFIMPLIKQKFELEDDYFFEKSTELCNAKVSAEQMGAPENYAVPLLAAVVELSTLDNHISPLEKINCLSTTYDLIFAELKAVLIDIISNFSVAESEIPVVNNSDIIPILMTVIIKSKLVHLASNFYYIETFLGNLNEDSNIRHVLNSFKEAIARLRVLSKESLSPACEKVCRDLDLIKLIKLTSQINTKLQQTEDMTPLDGHMLRLTNLIVTSTNENHPVL